MPARSKVILLPEAIRAELDKRIVTGGFGNYEDLSKWLNEQGYEIGRCAVQRHGVKLEQKLRALKVATENAKAIVEASPDDSAAMNDALLRLVQEKLFNILMELGEVDVEGLDFPALARAVADLGRAAVNQKRWMAETREKISEKVKAAGAQIDAAKQQGGLSPDAAKKIREALLDIRV